MEPWRVGSDGGCEPKASGACLFYNKSDKAFMGFAFPGLGLGFRGESKKVRMFAAGESRRDKQTALSFVQQSPF